LSDWYDKEGHPISIPEWGVLHRDEDYVRVGLTEVGPYVVSTVWIGLDHSWGQGPPVIFETMVFTKSAWHDDRSDPDHEQLLEIDAKRYCTLQEAQEGHSETVLLIEATLDQEPPVGPSEAKNGGSGPESGV
jgi:hypothetical protein